MEKRHILHTLSQSGLHFNQHKILLVLALYSTHEGYSAQSMTSLMEKTLLKRNQIQLHLDHLRKKKILKVHKIRVSGKSRYAVYYEFRKKK